MSELCKWIHEALISLAPIRYPFSTRQLPENGIYFFYEEGESWGHNGNQQRIVRIGTHREGNFRSRIKEHFLLGERGMDFDKTRPAPKDRSIFRKNIGRALLNRARDDYLRIWEIDFTTRKNLDRCADLRDIDKEKRTELEITRILRTNFSFRAIPLQGQVKRMGPGGLEARLIGTVAGCDLCAPSNSWLGRHSPKPEIRESGLWLIQHLSNPPIGASDRGTILRAIDSAKEKRAGHHTPDKLYLSPRIDNFIEWCTRGTCDWAIFSALYALFFPDEERDSYDVTFRTDYKYWLGIAVKRDGITLSMQESRAHVQELIARLREQEHTRQPALFYVYTPTPRRARCYLQSLHTAFDNCDQSHLANELVTHIQEGSRIQLLRSLSTRS